MQNPDLSPREPEQEILQQEIAKNNRLNVIKEGREEFENDPRVKELRKRLGELKYEHHILIKNYKFNEEGVRTGTIKNLSSEYQEIVRQRIKDLSLQLDKNETERAETRREIEEAKDKIKEKIFSKK